MKLSRAKSASLILPVLVFVVGATWLADGLPNRASRAVNLNISAAPTRQATEVDLNVEPSFSTPAPAGFDAPGELIADRRGAGVWFLANSVHDSRIFHASGNGVVQSWHIGDPQTNGLRVGVESGLAVGGNGVVWAGAGTTLARLDTTSGAVNLYPIPVADSPSAEGLLPPELQGRTHAVRAIAQDDAGHVAIVVREARAIEVFDDNTRTFSVIMLPSVGDATDLAYLPDGTLGVGLNDAASHAPDRIAIFQPGSTVPSVVIGADAGSIESDGQAFLTYWTQPYEITRTGETTALPLLDRSTHTVGPRASVAPQHRAVIARKDGLTILSASGSAEAIHFGTVPCAPPSGVPGAADSNYPPVSRCQLTPLLDAVDGGGNIWFVTNDWNLGLGEVRGGKY